MTGLFFPRQVRWPVQAVVQIFKWVAREMCVLELNEMLAIVDRGWRKLWLYHSAATVISTSMWTDLCLSLCCAVSAATVISKISTTMWTELCNRLIYLRKSKISSLYLVLFSLFMILYTLLLSIYLIAVKQGYKGKNFSTSSLMLV